LEDEEVQTLTETKPSCPECKSKNAAWLFYGYPGDIDWYLKAIDEKEIVGMGCLVTDHDSKWECTDCHWRWGKRDEDKDE
jgi:transposase-like protein